MVWTRSMTRRQDEEDQALIDMIPSQLSSLFSSQQDQPHSALGRAMYRPNDIHKKHRLPDAYPYDQTVRTYRRRTQP
jgi:hypothetical protein